MPRVRALIVEDEASVQHLVKISLESEDLDVAAMASDLATAVQALLADPEINVIVTDLHLPDSRGLDTVRQIRRIVDDRPIIAVTGDSTAVQGAVSAGADDIVLKDHLFERLNETVTKAVQRREWSLQLAQQARRANVFALTSVPLCLIDPSHGLIVDANAAMGRLCRQASTTGKRLEDLFDPAYAPMLSAVVQTAAAEPLELVSTTVRSPMPHAAIVVIEVGTDPQTGLLHVLLQRL